MNVVNMNITSAGIQDIKNNPKNQKFPEIIIKTAGAKKIITVVNSINNKIIFLYVFMLFAFIY